MRATLLALLSAATLSSTTPALADEVPWLECADTTAWDPASPSCVEVPGSCDDVCCDGDDLWTRPQLLGDPCGFRSELAESGVAFRGIASQFYQDVSRGGNVGDSEYGGKIDYFLDLDGGKLGLQEGLLFNLHAETRFGEDVNQAAVGFAPVNGNMLLPNGDQITAVTQLTATQFLNEDGWAVTAGKFNSLDFFDLLVHNGRGVDGFMNGSMLTPLGLGRIVPLSFLGAGALKFRETEVEGALLVLDTNNVATRSGFDTLFDDGASVVGTWRFFGEIDGKSADVVLGGVWSSRQYRSTDAASYYFNPATGTLVAGEETGSWVLFAIPRATLWEGGCDDGRKIEAVSTFSITDGNPNPLDWSMNVGVTAHGLVRCRPADSIGVGYFYTGLASEFTSFVDPVIPLRDVQGVELYYRAAVTPWFHLTADLQMVEPARKRNETAVVPGLRGVIQF